MQSPINRIIGKHMVMFSPIGRENNKTLRQRLAV